MNAHTGQTYELGLDLLKREPEGWAGHPWEPAIGDKLPDLSERIEAIERELTKDEQRALEDQSRGDSLVRVDPEVVQRLRLGDRELRRRKQRRR